MELATVEPVKGPLWWKTQDRETRLQQKIRSGMKYEDIAAELGTSLGSICAKANRLGINRGGPECGRGRGQPPQPFFWHGKPVSEAREPADGVYLEIEARQKAEADFRGSVTVSLVDSDDHHCRFVIGDPTKGRICGVRRKPGSFYCKEHHARCTSQITEAQLAARRENSQHATASARWRALYIRKFTSGMAKEAMWCVDIRTLEMDHPAPT